ncbi:Mrp/NBP35 family ATP-binding protein [Maribellus sp. CM-23]|uniref:Mrp/NBP35 family ATP-binding protein n=1 Tax=Maribellus sp. CM-23 TaxID=2781026 RepID=UPI001F3A8BC6|nr:Mrp/NBP35 family ATP-binding protein [Maribellus sp. CM-23]MCE4563940.1 Mrp/NBP35 family ATP-binding protein [Maribellus sp. CM-23]
MAEIPRKLIVPKNVTDALRTVKYPGSNEDIVALEMPQEIRIAGQRVSFSLVFQKSDDPNIEALILECEKAIKTYVGEEVEIEDNIAVKYIHDMERPVLPNVKNIIAIASGKGGVGKSTVSVNLAVALANSGAKVGLLDADIFGPSIPKMFGAEGDRPAGIKIDGREMINPLEKYGVKFLSVGFFVDTESAIIWRGPMASNALKQLISEGNWGDLDYLLIDLPPGTSDIHLTLVQSVPVTGAVIVTTPQDVALADVVRGASMFKSKSIDVPVLGLVENMAWFTPEELPENKYYIFGKDGGKKLADKLGLSFLGQIPIVQSIREGGDSGNPVASASETITGKAFAEIAATVKHRIHLRNLQMAPTKKVKISRK